ncbi:MAG: FkbM family methyltransferase [Bacteroidota bacterium]
MRTQLRVLLQRLLGTEGYLRLISRVYLTLVQAGLLREAYPELFFVDRLVQPGDVCLDIGANLGYYTVQMGRRVGPTGQVWAVEPVPLFARVLQANVERYQLRQVQLVQKALGVEPGVVQMATPHVNGVFRHGLTQVVDEATTSSRPVAQRYHVEMVNPADYFDHLERLDFVKCDVEGYETVVLPALAPLLERHRPVLQIEINTPEHRHAILDLLAPLGYTPHRLLDHRLVPLDGRAYVQPAGHDVYFLPGPQDLL